MSDTILLQRQMLSVDRLAWRTVLRPSLNDIALVKDFVGGLHAIDSTVRWRITDLNGTECHALVIDRSGARIARAGEGVEGIQSTRSAGEGVVLPDSSTTSFWLQRQLDKNTSASPRWKSVITADLSDLERLKNACQIAQLIDPWVDWRLSKPQCPCLMTWSNATWHRKHQNEFLHVDRL